LLFLYKGSSRIKKLLIWFYFNVDKEGEAGESKVLGLEISWKADAYRNINYLIYCAPKMVLFFLIIFCRKKINLTFCKKLKLEGLRFNLRAKNWIFFSHTLFCQCVSSILLSLDFGQVQFWSFQFDNFVFWSKSSFESRFSPCVLRGRDRVKENDWKIVGSPFPRIKKFILGVNDFYSMIKVKLWCSLFFMLPIKVDWILKKKLFSS